MPSVATGNAPFVADNKAPVLESEEECRRKIAEAKAFLTRALAGGARPARAILHEAARAGIAERTLYHAKAALGVVSTRQGYRGGRWMWTQPSASVPTNR